MIDNGILKDRLEKLIEAIEAKAQEDWDDAQGKDQVMHRYLTGWSRGRSHAAKMIRGHFSELLEEGAEIGAEDEAVSDTIQPSSRSIHVKTTYELIKSSIINRGHYNMVVKKADGWHFYNETWNLDGPYDTQLEAFWELYRYGQELNGVKTPSYKEIAPVLNTFLGVQVNV